MLNTVETVTIGVAALMPLPCLQNNNMSNVPAAVFNSRNHAIRLLFKWPYAGRFMGFFKFKDMGLVVRLADVDPKTGNAKNLSTGILIFAT